MSRLGQKPDDPCIKGSTSGARPDSGALGKEPEALVCL